MFRIFLSEQGKFIHSILQDAAETLSIVYINGQLLICQLGRVDAFIFAAAASEAGSAKFCLLIVGTCI